MAQAFFENLFDLDLTADDTEVVPPEFSTPNIQRPTIRDIAKAAGVAALLSVQFGTFFRLLDENKTLKGGG